MLTTLEVIKSQFGIPDEDTFDDDNLIRIIKSTTASIETYCRRSFSDEYRLPGEEESDLKPRLPYDVEDACVLWVTHRHNLSGNIGVSSERIDGLGQKNYRAEHIEGKILSAPPSVLALIDPYREMIYG